MISNGSNTHGILLTGNDDLSGLLDVVTVPEVLLSQTGKFSVFLVFPGSASLVLFSQWSFRFFHVGESLEGDIRTCVHPSTHVPVELSIACVQFYRVRFEHP